MSSSSMCNRPAVSTMTTSLPTALASASAPLARATGSISPAGSCTRTPACCATIASCWIAAGRRTSVETTIGWRPCFASHFASLPVVVVLPEPCSPSIKSRAAGRGFLQPALGIAEQRQQLIANDLDDLLRRVQALDLDIHRAIAHAIDERLDDLEVDVGFEQRQANLAEHSLNGRLGKTFSPLSDWKTSWSRLLSASNIGRHSEAPAPPRKPLSYMNFRRPVKPT